MKAMIVGLILLAAAGSAWPATLTISFDHPQLTGTTTLVAQDAKWNEFAGFLVDYRYAGQTLWDDDSDPQTPNIPFDSSGPGLKAAFKYFMAAQLTRLEKLYEKYKEIDDNAGYVVPKLTD